MQIIEALNPPAPRGDDLANGTQMPKDRELQDAVMALLLSQVALFL